MFKYKVYHSEIKDPRVNLAYEEYFLSNAKKDELVLFFWQSDNAVVIGRHQNPYQECNVSKLDQDQVTLVRRLSGGGAVYHDLGNLNFAFIAPNDLFDVDKQFGIMINAMKHLGISSEKSGRNDLVASGRKFSGNAFITEDLASLHHGTLLIDADITKISKYLTVSHKKLDTKGFDSVASRVINLRELNASIDIENIIHAVKHTLEINDYKVQISELPKSTILDEYMSKYNSHLWNYGECPDFNVSFEEKFDWGLVSVNMSVHEGKIDYFNLSTDSLETKSFEKFNKEVLHQDLTINHIHSLISSCFHQDEVINDLKSLIEREIFD